jgi:hypothetical protein
VILGFTTVESSRRVVDHFAALRGRCAWSSHRKDFSHAKLNANHLVTLVFPPWISPVVAKDCTYLIGHWPRTKERYVDLAFLGFAMRFTMRRQCVHYLQVSLSTFSYLFSEIIRYCQDRVDSVPALEQKYVAHALIVCAAQ